MRKLIPLLGLLLPAFSHAQTYSVISSLKSENKTIKPNTQMLIVREKATNQDRPNTMKTIAYKLALALLALSTIIAHPSTARAQGTAFTYQGRLNSGANPASGTYDLTFALFSVSSGAGQVGNTVTNTATLVSNGLFTTTLDFGANFPGADRWLEIGVRTNGGGSFATLSPRQTLAPTPYAIFANTASNVSGTVSVHSLSYAVPLLNDSGYEDFFAGGDAGTLTTGEHDVGIGFFALESNTTGSDNAALGYEALQKNTTGDFNTASGSGALTANTTGGNNTATGSGALGNNTTGTGNTASGSQALIANTTGAGNTASGFMALFENTTGSYNVANGDATLQSNTTGTDNTANGTAAMQHNTVGSYNAANGYAALQANTTGSYNVANGENALLANLTGSYNTANGYEALNANYNGFNNTADGAAALVNLTAGSYNIALGQNAGTAIVTGNNNIDIGNAGFGDESSVIRIGTSQTKAVMVGIYGATIASGGTAVYVNGSGLLGTITSSRRFKRNIQSMDDADRKS